MIRREFGGWKMIGLSENAKTFYEVMEAPIACHRAPVAQLVEHRAVTREVVSSTPAGPTLRVFK